MLSLVTWKSWLIISVDAQYAGSGNLEIMVNDGTIPCSVQNRGNRQFHASFMPKEPIPHYIQMRFNGKEVPGKLCLCNFSIANCSLCNFSIANCIDSIQCKNIYFFSH